MSSNVGTYLVIVTAAFCVTFLGYLLYTSFGVAAVKAAAPFVGTVVLVFAAAHALDKANDLEDAKKEGGGKPSAAMTGGGAGAPAAAAPAATVVAGAAGAGKSSTLPKRRRRIAD